jgi:nitrogen regulatory protein PII
MEMVMVSYNEAIEAEVIEVLRECGLKNYTKLMGVFGRGEASGTHLGSDIWPGRNNVLYIACEEQEAKKIVSCVKELRKSLGKEGIKAFVWSLEDIT